MTQNGILLIDKPEGPSSAQVVHQVKKILGAKKVGHLGTLDPFASGLLLIGVNEGTKIADIFLGGVKSYRGVMVLGIETDTQDGTGKVVTGTAGAEHRQIRAAQLGEKIHWRASTGAADVLGSQERRGAAVPLGAPGKRNPA